MVDAIEANAKLVVSLAAELGTSIGYDENGVVWLDGFIERQRERGEPTDRLISTLGSYLGVCVIRSFGGSWAQVDGSWCIRFDEKNTANPFAKVAKQLANGSTDSVLSFFRLIPRVFAKFMDVR